jgi:hypothetical protein
LENVFIINKFTEQCLKNLEGILNCEWRTGLIKENPTGSLQNAGITYANFKDRHSKIKG